jgi:hypothetical protein
VTTIKLIPTKDMEITYKNLSVYNYKIDFGVLKVIIKINGGDIGGGLIGFV